MRMFPIHSSDRRKVRGCPDSIPWEVVAPHEGQAKRNHCGQTLERLAERGGLGLAELYYVLRNEEWLAWALNTSLRIWQWIMSAAESAKR